MSLPAHESGQPDGFKTTVRDPTPTEQTHELSRNPSETRTQLATLPFTEHATPDLPAGLQDHPRYRVIRLIGSGGMGSVHLAEHLLMGRTVALKTIGLGRSGDPALIERFLREVRASAKLNHENVVAVFDAEQTADTLFFVMEHLEGDDLRELVRRDGPLDLQTACSLLRQATLGVQHAHEQGVIHRDIKPNNLFLVSGSGRDANRRVKVLDFGLAKVLQDAGCYSHGTPEGFSMGTVGYMSPEQESDTRSVGVSADIFSLGRTLYYLLTGKLPYQEGIRSLIREQSGQEAVVPLSQHRPELSSQASDLVERMTARKQQDRFQSCAEVLAALSRVGQAADATAQATRNKWWRFW